MVKPMGFPPDKLDRGCERKRGVKDKSKGFLGVFWHGQLER